MEILYLQDLQKNKKFGKVHSLPCIFCPDICFEFAIEGDLKPAEEDH